MAHRDPLADWQALGQQYWQGLTELGQKFITPAAPPPATPWAEGMEQWTRMFQGAQPSAQQGLFEQMLAQGKTYVSTLEELFKAGAGAGSQPFDLGALARSSLEQFRASQPWLNGLGDYGKWFDPAALDPDDPFVMALRRASVAALGREPQVTGGGGSDLRLPLVYAGCPTVLWGPAGGPIHSVDEWVDIEQMVEMLRVCLAAALEWCGPAEAVAS